MHIFRRKLAMLLVGITLLTSLNGCSSHSETIQTASAKDASNTSAISELSGSAQDSAFVQGDIAIEPLASPLFAALDSKQRNSISMLNHIVVLSKEISASKESRIYLEQAYSTILNQMAPDAVDLLAQEELKALLETLENYRLIEAKRNRLEYLYEQNKAQAVRDSIPNPIGLLSGVQSCNLASLAASVVYMGMDSIAGHQSSSSKADQQYWQEQWVLDDEEAANLHAQRMGAFDFMIETVRDYALPGSIALTEDAVDHFVEWKNKTNHVRVIQFFEENMDIYQAYGPYWLSLAEHYYENGDYQKCLRAIATYQSMQIGIFRCDYTYACTLSKAILAAQHVFDGAQYIAVAEAYAADILENTPNDDWVLHYFVAQTYIDLCERSGEKDYLQKAYEIVRSNVNHLIDEQKSLNAQYLADVQTLQESSNATKAEKKEIKEYNKLLKNERKTELPPVYEPLLVNCDLLLSLVAELKVSDAEKAKIDQILHENGDRLFLVQPLESLYSTDAADAEYDDWIAFDGKDLCIPACLLTENAEITVQSTIDGEAVCFSDWEIWRVDRENAEELSSFTAYYSSRSFNDAKFEEGARLEVKVLPREENPDLAIHCAFEAVGVKKILVLNGIRFEKVDE